MGLRICSLARALRPPGEFPTMVGRDPGGRTRSGALAGADDVPKQREEHVMAVGRVVIVGSGPGGATLAFLLARGGVEVALLERHPDFERTFRGDGLQPSGIDAFEQIGL